MRFVRVFYEGVVLSEMEWVQLDEFVGRLRMLAPDRFFKKKSIFVHLGVQNPM